MDRGQADRSPLDQLEAQVNLVLDHTGRLFANNARHHGPINNPLRLKQVVAGANDTFHDALDELENELTLARAVMRRDLAVYRAQRGARPKPDFAHTKDVPAGLNSNGTTSKDEDIVMGESPFEDPKLSPPKANALEHHSNQNQNQNQNAEQKQNSPLHLDIPGQDHQAAGNPSDANTGTFSNYDFESLFNDPSSAGAASRESPKDVPPPPSQPQTDTATEADKPATKAPSELPKSESQSATTNDQNTDFDFADLTNFGPDTDMQDTDGISSLLPGLESYANSSGGGNHDPQSQSATADFNIFDAAGAGEFGNANQAQKSSSQADTKQQDEHPPEMDNRDTTFDDIMNFSNFDLGDFSAGGEGEGGENKFDASFFDI